MIRPPLYPTAGTDYDERVHTPQEGPPMSADIDRQQAKVKEFMQILPLTVALAGLTHAEGGRPFTEAQLDGRSMAIRTAYKVARQLVMDIAKATE
jgi:hypothetical protein